MDGTVSVSNLWKSFGGSGFFTRWGRKVPALQGVSFELGSGELAALVGESGSGKTTLGRCLMGLVRFEQGEVRVNGYDVAALRRADERTFRMGAQMVFQNPYASLDPAFRVRQALAEAVRVHGQPENAARTEEEVEKLAHLVRLPLERLSEYPTSLSGGERRRVVFARALATKPRFVVTDEPVSGLDQPIQTQLLDLLRRIHERQESTMLFISHDLRLVRFLATRVMVLLRGRIVEDAPAEVFFAGPRHPYSRQLLTSAFEPDRALSRLEARKRPPVGEAGCYFRHRCGGGTEMCHNENPPLSDVGPCHRVACHLGGTRREGP
jgi:oligopeptide/dipeptide ABC transporter ATP-binding protein